MNPAAPSPSDSSIAQAFREIIATATPNEWVESVGITYIIKRAAEIDASAPAAAVGGDCVCPYSRYADPRIHHLDCPVRLASCPIEETSDAADGCSHGVGFDEDCASCEELQATPAAPVGGFVVVPIADVLMMIDVANEWGHLHHNYVRADDIERWQYSPSVEELHDRLKAMIAAPPTAQSSRDAEGYPLREGFDQVDAAKFDAFKAAQPSAKDGVRGDGPALPWRDISELEPSDDEHWFLRKDGRGWVVDGPRATQNHGGDEEDGWQWFCRCEHPPIEATTAAVLVEWRWVDEKGRAMTNWKQSEPPPMREVSDMKGTMRVEIREAAIGREVGK